MHSNYILAFSAKFSKKSKKLIKKNPHLRPLVDKVLGVLKQDPFSTSLDSHKVHSVNDGLIYSSRVSGYIRVLWDFSIKGPRILDVTDLGGHSGSKKVYK